MRVAIYARYSSEHQRETSLDDQIAVARRYAQQHGWEVLPDDIYTDAAVSGASIEGRSGTSGLLAATHRSDGPLMLCSWTTAPGSPETSPTPSGPCRRLKFRGVRVIYVSQGIDSASEQADALIAMHGLVDSLYLREMAKKIKRGLAGQLERGFVTGKTYGYRTVGVPSGKTDVNGHPELLGSAASFMRTKPRHSADVRVDRPRHRRLHHHSAAAGGRARAVGQAVDPRHHPPHPAERGLSREVDLGPRQLRAPARHEQDVRRRQPRSAVESHGGNPTADRQRRTLGAGPRREEIVRAAPQGQSGSRPAPGLPVEAPVRGLSEMREVRGSVAWSARASGRPRYGCIRARRQYPAATTSR